MNEMFRFRPAAMPRLASVEATGNLCIRVRWKDGIRVPRTDIVDLTPLISCLKFYKPLRANPTLFRTVRLVENGRAIAWATGAIDMAATSIERLAEEAMTGDDFRAFLVANNLTHKEAAAVLGRSRRQIENYLGGGLIPRVVVMACYGYRFRQQRARPSYLDQRQTGGDIEQGQKLSTEPPMSFLIVKTPFPLPAQTSAK